MNKNKINLVVQQENQSLMGSSNASRLQSWKWSTLFQISICYDYSCSIFTPHPLVLLFLKAGCTSFWRLRTGYRLFKTIFSVFSPLHPSLPQCPVKGPAEGGR